MPISVSLERLVSLSVGRELWPSVFSSMIAKIEEDGGSVYSTQWGAIGDWVSEETYEEEYAEAFWWLRDHPEVSLDRPSGYQLFWIWRGLPKFLEVVEISGANYSTPAGAVAALAMRLRAIKAIIGTTKTGDNYAGRKIDLCAADISADDE